MTFKLPSQKLEEFNFSKLDLSRLNPDQRVEVTRLMAELERRKNQKKFHNIFPDKGEFHRGLYPKHLDFMAASAEFKECAFVAGNRCGKTLTAAFMATVWTTGKYPDWWTGKRFNGPVEVWMTGDTGKTVRDILQNEMIGPVEAKGTGMLPGDCIIRTTPKSGIPDAIDTVYIRHYDDKGENDGVSVLQFKSYDQKRISFQGTAKHIIFLDEEPPLDIYSECLMRTMTTGGNIICTFTPLQGLTELIESFMPGGKPITAGGEGNKYLVMATWDDAPHLSQKDKDALWDSIPDYQKDARTKGIPSLGSGAIYPVPETEIMVPFFEIPEHFPRFNGMDVGWNCTSCVHFVTNPDTQVSYVYHVYKKGKAEPSVHAHGIRAPGDWIPTAIDPAARGRSQKDGDQLYTMYLDLGLDIVKAKNSVESGIYSVHQALASGQLKVFEIGCESWFQEYRLYRRDEDGKIVKKNDHAMDATRYGWVTGRDFAIPKPFNISGDMEWDDDNGADPHTGY